MSRAAEDLLVAFELHDVERIRAAIQSGADLHAPFRGKLPLDSLLEMYTRSDRFPACVRVLLDHGAELRDPLLAPVLLNDGDALVTAIEENHTLLEHRTTLVSAFTPLVGVTLLHVAAEYGHMNAARTLLDMGAEVDARAAVDELGLNGHTPLFHTVNSNDHRAEPVMQLLLEAGARTDVRLDGIVWGKGFDWETTCFDVTPVSYAQLGLLPQMHRKEHDVYAAVSQLLAAAARTTPPFLNVPNRYLERGA